MPITSYRCSKCRREYDSYKQARDCEKAHLTPVSAKVVSYTIRPFPYQIEVTFSNGEKRVYAAEDLGGGL